MDLENTYKIAGTQSTFFVDVEYLDQEDFIKAVEKGAVDEMSPAFTTTSSSRPIRVIWSYECTECGHVKLNNFSAATVCNECNSPVLSVYLHPEELLLEVVEYGGDIPECYKEKDGGGCYGLGEEFWEYNEMAESKRHPSRDVLNAGLSLGIPLGNIEDAYYGEYADYATLAEELAEETGALKDIPEWLKGCIDWEQAGQVVANDFINFDGFYFTNNY